MAVAFWGEHTPFHQEVGAQGCSQATVPCCAAQRSCLPGRAVSKSSCSCHALLGLGHTQFPFVQLICILKSSLVACSDSLKLSVSACLAGTLCLLHPKGPLHLIFSAPAPLPCSCPISPPECEPCPLLPCGTIPSALQPKYPTPGFTLLPGI